MRQILIPVVAMIAMAGCSTVGRDEFTQLQQEVAQAKYSADQAMRYATSAEMKAAEALAVVQSQPLVEVGSVEVAVPINNANNNEAKVIAERALKTALEAKAAAERANARAERMFQKSIAR